MLRSQPRFQEKLIFHLMDNISLAYSQEIINLISQTFSQIRTTKGRTVTHCRYSCGNSITFGWNCLKNCVSSNHFVKHIAETCTKCVRVSAIRHTTFSQSNAVVTLLQTNEPLNSYICRLHPGSKMNRPQKIMF